MYILKVSYNCVWHLGLLDSWTSSIIQHSKERKEYNISETDAVSKSCHLVFLLGDGRSQKTQEPWAIDVLDYKWECETD